MKTLDYAIIVGFVCLLLIVAIKLCRRGKQSSSEKESFDVREPVMLNESKNPKGLSAKNKADESGNSGLNSGENGLNDSNISLNSGGNSLNNSNSSLNSGKNGLNSGEGSLNSNGSLNNSNGSLNNNEGSLNNGESGLNNSETEIKKAKPAHKGRVKTEALNEPEPNANANINANNTSAFANANANASASASSNVGTAAQIDETDPIALIKTFSAPTSKRLEAIKKAGDEQLKDAVLPLIDALYEPDSDISNAAVESLAKINDPRAIEPVIEVSKRTDAEIMQEINKHLKTGDLKQADAAPSGELALVGAANPYRFKELVAFKTDKLSKEYFQEDGALISRKELVLKGLKDTSHQMRQMAAKAAIGLDSEELVKPLAEALSNQFEVEAVRFMAAEALGGIDSQETIGALLSALKDENVAVRYSAAAALSSKNDESVIDPLIEALSDVDQYVRSSAAYALKSRETPKTTQALFACAEDKSEIVRFSAAQALASFSKSVIYEQIEQNLESGFKNSILFCIEILGCINDEAAVNILSGYLKNEDSDIAFKASLALSRTENPDIINKLIEAAKRFDKELMEIAKKSVVAS